MTDYISMIRSQVEAEHAAAAAAGLTRQLTVRDFLDGKAQGADVFLWARGSMERVAYIRWPESDCWAVCPEDNGGFGCSYAVHYGTTLWTK